MAYDLTNNHDRSFTEADKFSYSTYILPLNMGPETFLQYADDLEKKSSMAKETAQKPNQRLLLCN